MTAPRIGTRVVEGTRAGVVVDHRPQGMVDVCFEDSGIVERRPAAQLLAMNPAAKRATLPAVRGKAAPAPLPADLYDPTQEQFRAVVEGVYETLVTKELGAKAFKDARGVRVDVKAIEKKQLGQEDVRRLLSRAYAIATRQGQKYGYLEAGTQRPTKKGAALAAARYGADPAFVSKLLKGDTKAQKLASAKDASKRAENRQDYEVTLQLARKGMSPRVVEEIVSGKLVSFAQPGAIRRKNVSSWEERGMARGAADFSSKMRPYLEDARKLGKQKGQALRQLSQVRKEKAKQDLWKLISQIDEAFQKVSTTGVEALGIDALDDRGLLRPEVRRDLGVLRKTYEDTAADVQAGRPVRNPGTFQGELARGREIAAQRRAKKGAGHTKGIGVAGEGYHWSGVRTGRKAEYTEVRLYATPPSSDPDRIGYFVITFDPNRKDVLRALREAKGWVHLPNVRSTEYEVGQVGLQDAPVVHKVVQYTKGGAGTRGVAGQFGKGFYGVTGPKARSGKDVFENKADAVSYARYLDQQAASFIVPQTHEVWKTGAGFEVQGPRAEEESAKRQQMGWENADLIFSDVESATRMAHALDYREAQRGALPITGYRTSPGMSADKAVETYSKTLAALADNRVRYVLDESAKSAGALSSGTKRFKRVDVDVGGIRYVDRYTAQDVLEKPDTLFVFGDNMEREGKGGQAIIRDEKNAVGIPTKWRPSRDEDAYFTNADFSKVKPEIDAAIRQLSAHLARGGAVVLPKDGVGTGLAELPKRAPRIQAYINAQLAGLEAAAKAGEGKRLPFQSRVITLPEAPTSARQKRLSEQAPELLVSKLLDRDEDPEKLAELIGEAAYRGHKKLVNLLAKSYEKDATETATMLATKKLGAKKVAEILSSEREKTRIRGKMPGAFFQQMRKYGEEQTRGFEKEASDLEVILAALYPDGKVPPTMLPKYERKQLLDMDADKVEALAKKKLGMTDAQLQKVLTSVERSVLSRIVAEQGPLSGTELISRGGFEEVELPKTRQRELEAQRGVRAPGAKPVPRPVRPEALIERKAAEKRSAELEKIKAEIAELQRLLGKKNPSRRKF